MKLFSFKCKQCEANIVKINSFSDIFLLKKGKVIECKQCQAKYAVPKWIQKIGMLYHYLFIGGLVAVIWLLLTVLIDNVLGSEIANTVGMWIWAISATVYLVMEAIVALILPLEEI